MNQSEIIKNLSTVENTLNVVEVKGRDNMGHILGCMELITSVIRAVSELKVQEEEHAEDQSD